MLKHMLIAVSIAVGVAACEEVYAHAKSKTPMPKAIVDPVLWNGYIPRVYLPEHNPTRSMILTPVKKKYMKGATK